MKRKGLAVGIILLFVGTCVIPVIAQDIEKSSLPTSRGHWLYVGGSGPGNYTMIQSAIDNASTGDTVFVYSGTYYENVVVNKIIDLIGEYKNTTIIDGGGIGDVVFVISDEVIISGFTLQNSGSIWPDSGIRLYYSNNNIIMDNIISNNHHGIQLFFSSNNTVTGNNASNNNRSIVLSVCSYNIIMGNNASNNENGIWVDFSSNNTVTGNNANSNNKRGIVLTSSSDNNIITGNNASDNYWGIYLSYSRNNIITGNNASNNYDGICLYHLSNKNNCYHNNFMNNTQNAYDEGNNTWDNGYPSGGNYWSDYTGTDDDGDGIGDTPYNISGGNNQDYYPLMFPYGMTRLTITIQPSTFKVTMLIKNVGNFTAFNVGWDITVKGGFIFFGRNSSGELPQPLQPGQEIMVKSRFLLGLGKIEMTYAAWADNAPIVSTRINGILLLFFFRPIGK